MDQDNLQNDDYTIEPFTQEIEPARYNKSTLVLWALGIIGLGIGFWQIVWGSPACDQPSCSVNQIMHISIGMMALFFAIVILGVGFLLSWDSQNKEYDRISKEEAVLEQAMLELEENGNIAPEQPLAIDITPKPTKTINISSVSEDNPEDDMYYP